MRISFLGSAALFLLQTLSLVGADSDHSSQQPNIIFIFTDDQDARLNSIDYMPNLQKHLVKQGTTYRNHYATIAVCCPSRVGLLRGQYAHNTNITDVSPPFGGYSRFSKLGLGNSTLPVWLQKAGYHTSYIGKLMNEYSINNFNNPVPAGFDYQDQLVDPYTYVYNKVVFSKNGQHPLHYKGAYQTDVIHRKTIQALKNQRDVDQPFFLWVAPMAPHGQFIIEDDGNIKTEPPVPAARHAHLFKNVKIPRTPNFNPQQQGKTASFWKHYSQLNQTLVEQFDEIYRNRLRALQAVDEMIGSLFEELEQQGKLDNTYVLFSSDNGYHIGHHCAFPGKSSNMEEDINVPFIVRGPGIPKDKVSDIVSAHHDLAPTILALAKRSDLVPDWVDGGVIPLTSDLHGHPKPVAKESFAVEFWTDSTMSEFYSHVDVNGPNIYKTVRVISENYNYMYSVWCTGEHEFYDLKKDPYETVNEFGNIDPQLVNRLDALLLVLKACRAESCRDPWRILHPNDSSVKTLADALHHKFDKHYTQYKQVTFAECLPFSSMQNELPIVGQHFLANGSSNQPLHNNNNNNNIKMMQKLLQPSTFQPSTSRQQRPSDEELAEIVRLHKLVPGPENDALVGSKPLDDDFEMYAQPVSLELVEASVDWVKHGFYSTFGN